jgi:hypothetical protein
MTQAIVDDASGTLADEVGKGRSMRVGVVPDYSPSAFEK